MGERSPLPFYMSYFSWRGGLVAFFKENEYDMVILKTLPFRDGLDLATMIEYDTKKVIQEHAKLINVSLPSSYRKGEMAQGLATLFQHDPFYTVNQLPMDEQKLIAQLINLKFDEYVEVPRNDEKHLMMQKVHLVVTYEDTNTWRLFMPGCVRNVLKDTAESQIGDIPGMMEYRKVLESLTECNIKLQEVMDREAGKMPISQASKGILIQLEKQYIEKREELRKIQQKYSWASDTENPIQQSIDDALMYIGFLKMM